MRPWQANVAWSPGGAPAEADTKAGTIAPASITIRAQVEASFELLD